RKDHGEALSSAHARGETAGSDSAIKRQRSASSARRNSFVQQATALGQCCRQILPPRLGDLKNRDIVLPVAGYSKLVASSSLKPDNPRYVSGNRLIEQAFAVGNLPVCAWPAVPKGGHQCTGANQSSMFLRSFCPP